MLSIELDLNRVLVDLDADVVCYISSYLLVFSIRKDVCVVDIISYPMCKYILIIAHTIDVCLV